MRTVFTEITCPDTGRTIIVAKNGETDSLHRYALDSAQRAAADQFREDIEAISGARRSASDGISWKGRKGFNDLQKAHGDRLRRAHDALGPYRSRLIYAAVIDGQPVSETQLQAALDVLARVYRLTTRAPSRTTIRSTQKEKVYA
jgi:hypothetical protein